jgi:hypothetical protein
MAPDRNGFVNSGERHRLFDCDRRWNRHGEGSRNGGRDGLFAGNADFRTARQSRWQDLRTTTSE